jgi:putative membrane protein
MMGFGLLVPIVIVVALAYAFGWLPNQNREPQHQAQELATSRALDILEERYARGEIDRTEYLEMRNDLREE